MNSTEALINAIADAFMKRARQAENKTEPIAGYHLAAVVSDIDAVGEAIQKQYPDVDITYFYQRSGRDRQSRTSGWEQHATQSEA